ncbi:MAG: SoxR reducing system RseC family protein [Deltaproteobacteria bacterium]|nr:SoxR reducing system RseC family protein [Deltaproteobacteria bacterium]MBW1962355.1 SoxR reducing system RseC family protein [Deltaproteobacteria bacterium]MBW2151668.1 SoxR reducing system RseC family protein [Deltaproteobacteria bacterium]
MAGAGLTTEEGVVLRKDTNTAWIKTTKTGACKDCTARGSCHTLGGGKEMEVEAINLAGARIGDRVIIGFETGSLLKASFLLYILPVLGLVGGALLGNEVGPAIGLNPEAASAVSGFLFLFLAFLFVRQKGSRLAQKDQYRPKVIRILPRKSE